MFTRIFAVLALLTVTAPASAATIQWNIENLPSGNSVLNLSAVSGFFDLNTSTGTVTNWYISTYGGLSSGNFTPAVGHSDVYGDGTVGPYGGVYFFGSSALDPTLPYLINQLLFVPDSPLDGSVNNVAVTLFESTSHVPSFSPTNPVTLEYGGEVAATPLPDALPLFGSALLALAGFAFTNKSRRE